MIKQIGHISLTNEKDQTIQVYQPGGSIDKEFPFLIEVVGGTHFEFGPKDIQHLIDMLEDFQEHCPEV